MWYAKKLTANRFMAFESISYDFTEGHSVMVQGKNLTDEGQESNGACKSAILEVVGILMTGRCIRLDTSAKDLVMNGEKSSYLEILLENPTTKQSMLIKREIFSNTKSATLEIELNGEIMSDITSVNEGNDTIIELLGIEKDDLLNYYLISKERFIPFHKLADSKKKLVIGRFSNSNIVSPIEQELDENILSVQAVAENILSTIERHEIKIETFEGDMSSFNVEEMQEKRDAKIVSLKESITDYESKIVEEEKIQKACDEVLGDIEIKGQEFVQENINNFQDRFDAVDKLETEYKEDLKVFDDDKQKAYDSIDKRKDSSLKAADKSEKTLDDELDESKLEKKGAEKLLAEVEKALMASVECPKCEHEFAPGEDMNIEKSRARKNDIQDIVDSENLAIAEIKGEIDDIDKLRRTIKQEAKDKEKKTDDQYDKDVADINKSLDQCKSTRKNIKDDKLAYDDFFENQEDEERVQNDKDKASVRKVKSYNTEITSLNEEISTVEAQVIKDRKSEFKTQITEVEKEIELEKKKLALQEEKLQWAQEEKSLFIRFKTHLSNKAIGSIEAHSNTYLEIAKSNIRIQLDGYKETKSGDIREKITTSVLRDGIAEGGIGKFSSGEKVRIEVANILALKKMINSASPTGGLDLLILDEVTNSLDSEGTLGVLNMLESVKETSILISHSTFHSMYPYMQTVVKENGISTIIDGNYGDSEDDKLEKLLSKD